MSEEEDTVGILRIEPGQHVAQVKSGSSAGNRRPVIHDNAVGHGPGQAVEPDLHALMTGAPRVTGTECQLSVEVAGELRLGHLGLRHRTTSYSEQKQEAEAADQSPSSFEVLDGPFVFLGGRPRLEGAEVTAFPAPVALL